MPATKQVGLGLGLRVIQLSMTLNDISYSNLLRVGVRNACPFEVLGRDTGSLGIEPSPKRCLRDATDRHLEV